MRLSSRRLRLAADRASCCVPDGDHRQHQRPARRRPQGDDPRGSKLRIAASTFSIYAFEALRKELEQVEELEFIFTSPTFVAEQGDGQAAARSAGSSSSRRRKRRVEPLRLRVRDPAAQQADPARDRAGVRRLGPAQGHASGPTRTGAPMQQFAVVDDGAAYMPLQGFTAADLGYERGNAVSNMVTKIDDAPMTAQYLQLFDQIWHNPRAARGRHRGASTSTSPACTPRTPRSGSTS